MGKKVRIAVVDDNAPQRFILSKLLGNDYVVEAFESGDIFLASTETFAVVLLDIGMPGLDGYDTCRALRKRPGGNAVSVVFVSAHDTADDRIAAYEAGGDDYVLKPVAAHELRHKLSGIVAHREAIDALAHQSNKARVLVQKAFSKVGDLGMVVDALRKLATQGSHEAVADLFVSILKAWDLNGAVRVIGQNDPLDRTTDGPLTPLAASVLATRHDSGHLFEFGSRALVTYPHIAILIHNLPIDEPERRAGLREHLSTLAECADLRIRDIEALNGQPTQSSDIGHPLAELGRTLVQISEQGRDNLSQAQHLLVEPLENLERALDSMSLTDIQRAYLDDLFKGALDDLHRYFDRATDIDLEFREIVGRLLKSAANGH